MLERFYVSTREIVHVDVVSDARAVGRGIVRAEDLQLRPLSRGGAQGERNQVGLGIVQLADLTALIGSRRVEISQADKTKSVGAIVGLQRLLENNFVTP